MTTTENKTNDLRFSINTVTPEGDSMVIKISLNDECKNGHNDFSITGSVYEKGKPKMDRYHIAGGCIHDIILSVRPDLQMFVDLHLCDSKGVPMYAIENGFYHLKNSGVDSAKDYLRLTTEEATIVATAEDKTHFAYLIQSLNVPQRWNEEAKQAIAKLEEWTGKTFVDDSKKVQWTPLTTDQVKEIEEKIANGYYSPEQLAERQAQKIADTKQKEIQKLKADRDKDISKANDEYNVKIAVLEAGLSLSNFIYYNHSNEGRFNWLDYNKAVTEEQFNNFLAIVDYSKLPEGIKFKIGK